VQWTGLKRALTSTYRDIVEKRTLQMAAALSYYLVLSVFPALILFFAAVTSLPFTNLYARLFTLICGMFPAQAIPVVQAVILDVLVTNPRTWLSLGTIGTIWIASSAFDAMIEALDVAYDVKEVRPFWKTRLLAVALAATTGCLLLSGLTVMILGPRFGEWLSIYMGLSAHFAPLWPVFHWLVAITVALIAVELMYFMAPNVKQRLLATLPGAILAVVCWIVFSYLLGFYFRHVANFNRTYGTLGGFIAFMTWFYWNSFALLVGAELNAELASESKKGSLQQKQPSDVAEPSPADSEPVQD
jgi:membrane protein